MMVVWNGIFLYLDYITYDNIIRVIFNIFKFTCYYKYFNHNNFLNETDFQSRFLELYLNKIVIHFFFKFE